MTDQPINNLARELREAERLESGLGRLFDSLQPPFAADQRLLAKLDGVFHESQLTLDDAGPYSFEEALAQSQAAGSDLLAAGLELEEEPIDEQDLDLNADLNADLDAD